MSLLKKVNEASHLGRGQFNTKLAVTDEMLRQAKGNKFSFIATISPENFLKLTTSSRMPPDYFKEQCKTLDQYNQWAQEGETIIMPALWIKGDTVVGHEGRHRAAALICSGNREMPVAVRLYPQAEHEEKYGYWEAPYDMKYEDMPRAIHGEYGSGIVMRSNFNVVIDGWHKLRQQISEARIHSIHPAQVADMYNRWEKELNMEPEDIVIADTGYNQSNNTAYIVGRATANSKEEAISILKKYTNRIPLPITRFDATGPLGRGAGAIFFDRDDEWIVTASYTQ